MSNRDNVIELDVREDIKLKNEPFHKIMGVVSSLKEGETFVLHAPFNPVPLLKVMKNKGFDHEVLKIDSKHYHVTFYKEEEEASKL
ncbi:DUF2249 domain-containing protein [Pontibacillus sp. HMF3514]|uniref:DUF2249 domain-containing protein n=1 Tax=Pontibacillus sp. HMF3514 TaxID=2692425 RepID=UPI0013202EBA|nr:DUF2249 domain-containing protein [Pontibacillus sp. HMF3514]QHE51667.1 DUF2249 domain-containing protein [Pontibacillus sp. HMF3514]